VLAGSVSKAVEPLEPGVVVEPPPGEVVVVPFALTVTVPVISAWWTVHQNV
jgi:hypothetical protein